MNRSVQKENKYPASESIHILHIIVKRQCFILPRKLILGSQRKEVPRVKKKNQWLCKYRILLSKFTNVTLVKNAFNP